MALMVVFVLSFNGIGRALATNEAQETPIARLFDAGRALHGARRVDELGRRVLDEMRPLFRFDELYLVLVDGDLQVLDFRVHERLGVRMPRQRKPIHAGMFGWVIETARPILIEDWAHAPALLRERAEETGTTTGSFIVVPLLEGGEAIGLLSVQHAQPRVYSQADLNLLQNIAEHVASAIANARAFEDLENYRTHLEDRVMERTADLEKASREKERLIVALREQSSVFERAAREDALTGVANRRSFMQRLAAELEVAHAVGHPLTLAIVDLDRFKIVNDDLGHTIGDEALRQSAALMRSHCRDTDLVARIGGEEFALILPGMSGADAAEFCERLRFAIEAHEWLCVHPHLRVTVSIGVAQWNGAQALTELLGAADVQLYSAKRAGRNRVA
jgi:diguanylate cyclase (GGDEF)-like protein